MGQDSRSANGRICLAEEAAARQWGPEGGEEPSTGKGPRGTWFLDYRLERESMAGLIGWRERELEQMEG